MECLHVCVPELHIFRLGYGYVCTLLQVVYICCLPFVTVQFYASVLSFCMFFHVLYMCKCDYKHYSTLIVKSGLDTALSYEHSTYEYVHAFVPTHKTVLINLVSNGSRENSS